ncbi:MAG: 5-formyltetrahydrofolate cyclo-ligase [Oligoflexia bacterium]|nr:5-formyltetrahydrofolate cyclo-ligase [Oligoflexia bacterium]
MSRKSRKALRREMVRITSSLDKRWLEAASSQICGRVGEILDRELGDQIEHVLAFFAHFPGEVDLSAIIAKQLGRRQVYLPRIESGLSMRFFSISKDWYSQLEPGPFGILQPRVEGAKVYSTTEGSRTAAIVPGLAFDREGNRLSRDRGQYDVFLTRPELVDTVKIGVCWSLQLIPAVPADSHHVMVDWLCHERDTIRTATRFDENF